MVSDRQVAARTLKRSVASGKSPGETLDSVAGRSYPDGTMAAKYSIAAVAKITGLSIETLRAWERRHGVVSPQRDDSGIRRYTEADIARLELLHSATGLGHAIRRVASLPNAELRKLVHRDAPEDDSAELRAGAPIVQKVVQCIRRYDVRRAEELLSAAALLQQPDDLVINVLSPLMREVGRLWERRNFSVAQEHLVSVLVRNLLGSMMRLRPVDGETAMLFATPPNELHEFGIDLAAFLAAMRGIRACVLGPNVPMQEVVRAAHYVRPSAVVIGSVLSDQHAKLGEYLKGLRTRLTQRTKIWVGGEIPDAEMLPVGVRAVPTLTDFAKELSRQPA